MLTERQSNAIRLAQTDVEIETSPWPHKPMTLKRCVALIMWWVVCLTLPLFAIPLGAMVGAVKGAGSGAYDALSETYADLHRWWKMFEGN